MKRCPLLVFLLPLFLSAQSGLEFEDSLNWAQIKDKAQSEHKFIFVDCFTTWCGPCKLMDKEVFPKASVGQLMNQNFISVRIQMDTTAYDKQKVKDWYNDAQKIKTKYSVTGFPTFLFFNPNGELVHIGIGAHRESDFIKLASQSLSEETQYFPLLKAYMQGRKSSMRIKYLAYQTKAIGNTSLSDSIAGDYVDNYLNKEVQDSVLTETNVRFLVNFPHCWGSKDLPFRVIQDRGGQFDSVLKTLKNVPRLTSRNILMSIVDREEVRPYVQKAKGGKHEPDWTTIRNNIKRKYGRELADVILVDAKYYWYVGKNDKKNIAKYYAQKIEKFGLDSTGFNASQTNNIVWDVIIPHINDRIIISKAISWMSVIVRNNATDPSFADTFAHLLYKAGQKKDAITWEQKALTLSSDEAEKAEFKMNLSKMGKGEKLIYE
jgi:thioredoxin-related protein